ncbi:MAG: hypothetical protein LBD24_03610 [Spirochaetaceae bacterium]|nr:hypothetical protein [Spirochaetaceae bacterium]
MTLMKQPEAAAAGEAGLPRPHGSARRGARRTTPRPEQRATTRRLQTAGGCAKRSSAWVVSSPLTGQGVAPL